MEVYQLLDQSGFYQETMNYVGFLTKNFQDLKESYWDDVKCLYNGNISYSAHFL